MSIISNTVSNLYEGNEQISILSSEYYQHKLTKSLTDNDIKEQSDGYTLTTFFDSKYLTYPIEKNTIELTAISKQKNVLINFKTYLNAKLSALKKVNLWTLLKTFRLDNKLKSSDIKYYVGSKAGKVNIGKINSRHLAESLLYAIR